MVLIVDDEPTVRRIVSLVLEKAGFKVLQAPCGFSALDLLRKHLADVSILLTDVMMEGMNGPDLVSQARKIRPDLACVYMSGTYFNAGEAPFVQKPFNASQLIAAIRSVADPWE
jgi:CheY-like chemotaxis protein